MHHAESLASHEKAVLMHAHHLLQVAPSLWFSSMIYGSLFLKEMPKRTSSSFWTPSLCYTEVRYTHT